MSEKIENLREKADQLIKAEKWNELIQVATELINLEKEGHDKAMVHCARGGAYLYRGKYERALEDFNEAIKLNPEYADAYCNRGYAYINKNKYERALEDFNKAIRLNPEHADAYCGRGTTYINKQNFDSAIANCNKAIKLNPEHVFAHYACGIAYYMKLDFGNAFKKFNTVTERDPTLKTNQPFVYIASRIKAIDSFEESKQIKAFAIYTNLLDTVSEIQYELFYLSKELKSAVAHYTSLHTLRNLSKRRECFRLYNTDYMNDPEEGQIFFKIMKEEYPMDKDIDIRKCFYKNKDKSYRSPAYIGSFVRLEKENKQKDKLFFWRTYGRHDGEEAAGACLIFNNRQCFSEYAKFQFAFMERHPSISQKNLALYEICYRGELDDKLKEKLKKLAGQLKNIKKFIEDVQAERIKNQFQQIVYKEELKSVLEKECKKLGDQFKKEEFTNNKVQEKNKTKDDFEEIMNVLKIIRKFMNDENRTESIEKFMDNILPKKENKTEDALRQLVCELLDNIRFLFKEKHYREEKEVRVIQWYYSERGESLESQIKVDVENIPPHFYLDAPESVRFSEVILGPKTKNIREWKQWLKTKAREQGESIDIKQSEIKYGKS